MLKNVLWKLMKRTLLYFTHHCSYDVASTASKVDDKKNLEQLVQSIEPKAVGHEYKTKLHASALLVRHGIKYKLYLSQRS